MPKPQESLELKRTIDRNMRHHLRRVEQLRNLGGKYRTAVTALRAIARGRGDRRDAQMVLAELNEGF